MFWNRRLSETAKAVLWLWENDAKNWCIGSHAVVHQQTGVGVWTANEEYGLSLYYEIPDRDRAMAHPCNGSQVKLVKSDRRALHKVIILGNSAAETDHREIQQQIADWCAEGIEHRVGKRTRV